MVPIAKGAILLVLLGGASVSTYAIAGGFGPRGSGSGGGNGEATQVSKPESTEQGNKATEPTVGDAGGSVNPGSGAGTGEETRTASGGEETRTASGEQSPQQGVAGSTEGRTPGGAT